MTSRLRPMSANLKSASLSFFKVTALCLSVCFRIAQRREEAVSREIMKKVADDKRMTRKEKDERYETIICLM